MGGSLFIPPRIREAIDRYWRQGLPPGGFTRACLENDLRGACERGDDECITALFGICFYLQNKIPSRCWGSVAVVSHWLNTPESERLEVVKQWDDWQAREK